MNKDLLIALATAVGTNEKVQRRFRTAVLTRLARIETILGLVHVWQLADSQRPKQYFADKLDEDARAAEEYVSEKSHELGLKMVRYIHTDAPEPEPRFNRRRKWSDWVI